MAKESEEIEALDERREKMGRVIPFRIKIKSKNPPTRKTKIERLGKNQFKVENDRLVEEGFGRCYSVSKVICTSYVKEKEKILRRFEREITLITDDVIKIYDMIEDSDKGFILIGCENIDSAKQYLIKYMEVLGIKENHFEAEPLNIGQAILKEIFHSEGVFPRGLRTSGQSIIDMHTKLVKIFRDKYFEALEEQGIDSERWVNIEVMLPAIPGLKSTPPFVKIYENGFMIRDSRLKPQTWDYARYVLRAIETLMGRESVIKRKWTTLHDFIPNDKGG